MPPDRTTSSFVESINTGAPLSSKGAQHAPSLERGKVRFNGGGGSAVPEHG